MLLLLQLSVVVVAAECCCCGSSVLLLLQVIDHDMIRACWQKGRHPVLRLVRDFEMPQLPTVSAEQCCATAADGLSEGV